MYNPAQLDKDQSQNSLPILIEGKTKGEEVFGNILQPQVKNSMIVHMMVPIPSMFLPIPVVFSLMLMFPFYPALVPPTSQMNSMQPKRKHSKQRCVKCMKCTCTGSKARIKIGEIRSCSSYIISL